MHLAHQINIHQQSIDTFNIRHILQPDIARHIEQYYETNRTEQHEKIQRVHTNNPIKENKRTKKNYLHSDD